MDHLEDHEKSAVVALQQNHENETTSTILHGLAPRIKYRTLVYPPEERVAAHFGQAKLGVGLVNFLAEYGNLASTVVYAGAAPGTNITQVAKLFTKHTFYLYDPSPFRLFDAGVTDARDAEVSKRIFAVQDFFTDAVAESWAKSSCADEGLLFVSDIRTSENGDIPLDSDILRDLEMQWRWYRILGDRAKASMLKFRLPFNVPPESIWYPEGQIWLQPWAPPTSTETRLILLPGAHDVKYNTRTYEEELFFHNIIRREWQRPCRLHCQALIPGFDGCYDCSAAVAVFEKAFERDFAHRILASFLQGLHVDLRTHCGHYRQVLKRRSSAVAAREDA